MLSTFTKIQCLAAGWGEWLSSVGCEWNWSTETCTDQDEPQEQQTSPPAQIFLRMLFYGWPSVTQELFMNYKPRKKWNKTKNKKCKKVMKRWTPTPRMIWKCIHKVKAKTVGDLVFLSVLLPPVNVGRTNEKFRVLMAKDGQTDCRCSQHVVMLPRRCVPLRNK